MICDNYKTIKEETETLSGGKATLIAVSKTKSVCMLEDLYKAGCREFGENKVQELVEKYEQLPKDIKWHMIGHLQKNKVKYIVDKVCMIHSVDSYELALEIEKQAAKKEVIVKILIEVNVALEESKFGLTASSQVIELIRQIATLTHIKVCGLMTIAPYTDRPEENRQYFKALYQLSVDITKENIDNIYMDELSMGMSNDYKIALTEGATYVRVGTKIFGERIYNTI